MLNHFNCSRSHKMAVSKNTSPSPQLSSFFPSPLSPPTSVLSPLLCATSFLYPLPPLPRSLPHSLCVLCQRLLQCRYSVKRACQQLDLSLDPIHIPSSPSLWSYFDPSYTAQKGIHLIDSLCFNVKVAWASHYLIARFILLVPEKRLPVSTPPNLLTRQDRWFHASLYHLYYLSLGPVSSHLVTHFSYNHLCSHAPVYPFLSTALFHSFSHINLRPFFSTLPLTHLRFSIYLLVLCLGLRFLGTVANSGVLPLTCSPNLPPHSQRMPSLLVFLTPPH